MSLIAIALVALIAAPGAVAKDAVNTKVVLELDYHDAAHFREYFATVTSKRQKCVPKRKVVVFELFIPGPEKVFDDKTDETGLAIGSFSGFDWDGTEIYIAKIRERKVGNLKCRAAESAPVVPSD